MRVRFTDPQHDFVMSDAAHPGFFGGFGAGKSQAGTIRLLKLIGDDPGADVSHFFPSYRLAERRGLRGTTAYLKMLGIRYVVNKSLLTVFLPDLGSTIYLETYHDPDAMVSFEVAHSVVDELDTLPRDAAALVWQKATERTRQQVSRPNSVACVTTPDQGTAGFCYELWGEGERVGEGYEYIKAGTRTNKFLPPGYADQIAKNYDPIMAEAFLEGGWVSFTAHKVYHFFNRVTHHSDRALRSVQEDSAVYVGLDFNIGGCCAVTFVVDPTGPVAVDEFVSHDTRDFINRLSRYAGRRVVVYPDASGRSGHTNASESDISMIRAAGFQIEAHGSNPPIRDRINAYNALLAHGRLAVNTRQCPNLTDALETQGYDEKGEPQKWKKHPAIDDWVDASGYFIAYRYPIGRALVQTRMGGI